MWLFPGVWQELPRSRAVGVPPKGGGEESIDPLKECVCCTKGKALGVGSKLDDGVTVAVEGQCVKCLEINAGDAHAC